MRILTVGDLALRLKAQEATVLPQTPVTGFATDHRQVQPGDAFIAIRGARVDGHEFCQDAANRGASFCLVEQPVSAPYLLVPNVAQALASLGRSLRDEFKGPVVGVTGSVGKTTAKEMIAAALSPLGEVLKSQGNRNTEWTSPLVWTECSENHRAAVIEMSMRGFGQIAHLAQLHQPTLGVITLIGSSHLELVGSLDGVARAKRELLEALPVDGLAIINRDDPYADYLASGCLCKVATFGTTLGSDVKLAAFRPLNWHSSEVVIEVLAEGDEIRLEQALPFAGRHFAMNACAAIAAAIGCGVDPAQALKHIAAMEPIAGRMDVLHHKGATLVYDAYNASPNSFAAALEALATVPVEGRRIVVAGEMKELGDTSIAEHRHIAKLIAESRVDTAVFFGEAMEVAYEALHNAGWPLDRAWIAPDHAAIRTVLDRLNPGDCVLIKGSRAMELDRALPDGVHLR